MGAALKVLMRNYCKFIVGDDLRVVPHALFVGLSRHHNPYSFKNLNNPLFRNETAG